MGFITKLFSDSSDADFKLAQDLVAIAIADGEISEKERKAITDICRSEGVTEEVINDYLLGFDVGTTALVNGKKRQTTFASSSALWVLTACVPPWRFTS